MYLVYVRCQAEARLTHGSTSSMSGKRGDVVCAWCSPSAPPVLPPADYTSLTGWACTKLTCRLPRCACAIALALRVGAPTAGMLVRVALPARPSLLSFSSVASSLTWSLTRGKRKNHLRGATPPLKSRCMTTASLQVYTNTLFRACTSVQWCRGTLSL
jgi:hypothetical protein